MRTLLVVALLAVPLLLAPAAVAGIEWLPYCKDKEVNAGVVNVHVGVDCSDERYVEVCVPGQACARYDVTLS